MRQQAGDEASGTPDRPGTAPAKPGLHPRNRHRRGYDFPALVQARPELAGHLRRNPAGAATIDFADPAAVKALNGALLALDYGVAGWDIPPGYLCPPVPGRADYVHHAADLLGADAGVLPRGAAVRVLDVGVGANAVYPLIGHREYGWTFLGSETDRQAAAGARAILAANPDLAGAIEIRIQPRPDKIFQGLLRPGEAFHLCLCNPPFHASATEAREGSQRKWRNLKGTAAQAPVLNFGGQGGELWCPGGEAGFLARMIAESAAIPERILWFTGLVSRAANLPFLRRALRQAGAQEVRVLPMAQGQKQSRILAWTYLDVAVRRNHLAVRPDRTGSSPS